MYEIYDTGDFESFVSDNLAALGCKISKSSLKDILNEDFDNILYLDRNEIEIKHSQKSNSKYYEFTKTLIPKKIGVRFGCELETCFILNCKNTDVLSTFETEDFKNGVALYSSGEKWQEMILYHLRNNIIPYLSNGFLNIFRFAYIYPGYHSGKGIFIDMKNGNVVKKRLEDEGYRTLIFEPDGSIKCNSVDKERSSDVKAESSEDSLFVSCEIVTPILSSIEELRILLNGLTLSTKSGAPMLNSSAVCNQSNASMGFHINVSAYDNTTSVPGSKSPLTPCVGDLKNPLTPCVGDSLNPLALTRGMFAELIYDWIEYEKKNYKKLRGEGSDYAVKIQDYLNDPETIAMTKSIIVEKNGDNLGTSELYKPYGAALWYITEIINSEKMLSMTHWKRNNVIEFRVFNSTTDIEQLISYTQDAIGVFQGAIQRYCDNPKETLVQIQKNNLKYKYAELQIPFLNYKGDYEKFWNYCKSRGDCKIKFGYKKIHNFFGLRSSVKADSIWSFYNFDEEKSLFNIVIEFETKVYYSYNAELNNSSYTINLDNPIEISKEEFEVLQNIFRGKNKYWMYYE